MHREGGEVTMYWVHCPEAHAWLQRAAGEGVPADGEAGGMPDAANCMMSYYG